MKALSFRQPWAHFVLHENKRLDNRLRRTSHRGPLLVHVSKSVPLDYWEQALWWTRRHVAGGDEMAVRLPPPKDLPRGGVIGIASVSGSRRSPSSLTSCGPWEMPDGAVLVLDWALPLPFVPCRGQLGLWEAPSHVLDELGLPRITALVEDAYRSVDDAAGLVLKRLGGLVDVRESRYRERETGWRYGVRLTSRGAEVKQALEGDPWRRS